MKRLLLVASVIALGAIPAGATESSVPSKVQMAAFFWAPLQAPAITSKAGYYWGGCCQTCGIWGGLSV